MIKKYTFSILFFTLFLSFFIWLFFPFLTNKDETIIPPGKITIVDRNNIPMTNIGTEGGYFTPFSFEKEEDIQNIPFIKSLIEIEDKSYFSHFGVHILAKLRALKGNITEGKITSGGSTITEQRIKNAFFIRQKRNYSSKLREACFALYFSIVKSKKEVLENYLNSLYLGKNIYGLQSALEIYFSGKEIENLTEEEITLLLGLIRSPGIETVKDTIFVTYAEKIKTKLGYDFTDTIFVLDKKENIDPFPFITKKAKEHCEGKKEEFIFFLKSDCTTMTFKATLDSKLSLYARNTANMTIDGLIEKNVSNSAIFAIHPFTSEVLIYEGSRDFYSSKTDGQVDVIESLRQPGSTMKPFLYYLALKNGFSPDDFILDIESEYNSFKKDSVYVSENYSLKEYGLVKLKKALGNSFNNASVRLAKELGLGKVYDNYKDFGIILPYSPEHYGYSLVLGNPSISLKNMVSSYNKLLPRLENGKIDKEKYLLYDMLKDPDNRDVSFGVNSILSTSVEQAVKTGTSSDFKDNLAISYDPNFVMGLWVGNNDNSSMIGVTGITGAGYIWHQIIEKAIEVGIIIDGKIPLPVELENGEYCFDTKCYQKEIILKEKGKDYYSAPKNGLYDIRDIKENLSREEKTRLEELGFNIQ